MDGIDQLAFLTWDTLQAFAMGVISKRSSYYVLAEKRHPFASCFSKHVTQGDR